MPFVEIASFLQQATAQGSRSTVLRPLAWLIGILSALFIGIIRYSGPAWAGIVTIIAIALAVLLYMGVYVYCLRKKPDLLRTEKYSIQKLAIEKGVFGNSLSGVVEANELKAQRGHPVTKKDLLT